MNHVHSIDMLRGIAAFGIVGCHLMLYPKTAGSAALTGLCDMFVGLFAALSGFWMGIKGGPKVAGDFEWLRGYVRKRIWRILPIYFVWTLAYVVFGLVFDLAVRGALPEKWFTVKFWISSAFLGGASCHLWFLACLFYGQLILGMIILAAPNARRAALFLGGFILIVASAYSPARCWWTFYPLRLFAFLVSGYAIAMIPEVFRKDGVWIWAALLAAGVSAHYLLSGFLPQFVRDYFVALPLLIVAIKSSIPGRLCWMAEVLGKTSMGVFLIHPIFAAGLGLLFKKTFAAPYGMVPWIADWLCCWGGSVLVALVLLRIPFARKFAT